MSKCSPCSFFLFLAPVCLCNAAKWAAQVEVHFHGGMTSTAHMRRACDHPPPDGVWRTNASWGICSGVKRIPQCVSTHTGNEWNSVCVWNCDKAEGEPYLAKVTGVQAKTTAAKPKGTKVSQGVTAIAKPAAEVAQGVTALEEAARATLPEVCNNSGAEFHQDFVEENLDIEVEGLEEPFIQNKIPAQEFTTLVRAVYSVSLDMPEE
mmetsp:Transcript_91502/g.151571  ORF Transcript_91502/g.151571 Transcript_91502/m.151571 type:complete len:207 (+) Transcript_91502:80-700(+)